MKIVKVGIRFWMTLVSLFSFVGGWIMLVHAPKPFQGNSSQSDNTTILPTLEPLAPLSDFGAGQNSEQNQPLFNVQPPARFISPMFRTGGS